MLWQEIGTDVDNAKTQEALRSLGQADKKIDEKTNAINTAERSNIELSRALTGKVTGSVSGVTSALLGATSGSLLQGFRTIASTGISDTKGKSGKDASSFSFQDKTVTLTTSDGKITDEMKIQIYYMPENPTGYIVHIAGNGTSFQAAGGYWGTSGGGTTDAGGRLIIKAEENDVAVIGIVVGKDENRAALRYDPKTRGEIRQEIIDIGKEIRESDPDALLVGSGHSTGSQVVTKLVQAVKGDETEKAQIEELYDTYDYIVPIDLNKDHFSKFTSEVKSGKSEYIIEKDQFIYATGSDGHLPKVSTKLGLDTVEGLYGEDVRIFDMPVSHTHTAASTFFGYKDKKIEVEGIWDTLKEEHDARLAEETK